MVSENEHQFQHDDISQVLDVVAGVDFGTSFTKVVVNVPYYVGNPAFAVPFGEFADKSLKYLLPTRLFIDKDLQCSFTSTLGSLGLTDIKLYLDRGAEQGNSTGIRHILPRILNHGRSCLPCLSTPIYSLLVYRKPEGSLRQILSQLVMQSRLTCRD